MFIIFVSDYYKNVGLCKNIVTLKMSVNTRILTPTERKLYLELSREFQKVLDDAPSFQMGIYQWNLNLADRLQKYGLTSEVWEQIALIGDNDEELQTELSRTEKEE